MAPFFTFFVDKKESDYAAPFIRDLDLFYPSFVDSVYTTPLDMKTRYKGANAKFFTYDGPELLMFDLEQIDEIEPLLALTMDTFTEMSDGDWQVVKQFLKNVFEKQPVPEELLQAMHLLVPAAEKVPEKVSLFKSVEIQKPQNTEYMFDYDIHENTGFFQITKPYTDKPYTCVVRDFDKAGYEPIFTSLYVCQSWGVSNHDHLFLQRLWVHLGMAGELDLENRLKQEIELCKNGKREPEVYRADIDSVKSQMSRKKKRADGPYTLNKRL
jgi:hypothetical protein